MPYLPKRRKVNSSMKENEGIKDLKAGIFGLSLKMKFLGVAKVIRSGFSLNKSGIKVGIQSI